MIRIVVADDHTIVREGIKQILSTDSHLAIVGEAQNGQDVLACIQHMDFDVLLLDMSMPGKSGIELIKQIKAEKPKLRILVLSMHEEHQYAIRAIKAGASGYLVKEGTPVQLLSALRKVASGGIFISADVAEQLALNTLAGTPELPHETLSDREFQIFRLLASGVTVSDIANQLYLSVKTISTHKTRLMQKMGMNNQSELVHYAITHHIVSF